MGLKSTPKYLVTTHRQNAGIKMNNVFKSFLRIYSFHDMKQLSAVLRNLEVYIIDQKQEEKYNSYWYPIASEITTNLVAENNANLFFYSSQGPESKITVPRAVVLLDSSEGNLFSCLFQLVKATHISWPGAPSHITPTSFFCHLVSHSSFTSCLFL